ncbi:helix-turn-helix domain-containing protein [Angustibacter aerolatus]
MAEVRKFARITGEARTQMSQHVVAEYNQGHSIREIAEETGRSYGFVHRVLRESDVTLRGRGGPTRRPRR